MRRSLPYCLLLASAVLPAGCPDRSDQTIVRVAADRTLKDLGLVEYVLAAFEEETKTRTRLVYADTETLGKQAASGNFDYAFVVSEETQRALEKQSIPIRSETYAHEEFVVIGPWENMLGTHSEGDAVELMMNIARSSYRFVKGKVGSVEYARYQALFEKSGDRLQPGSVFKSDLEGTELVNSAIESRAFALVKRSSLLQAALQGHMPHRIYREADPELVLRMVLVEIDPARTRMERKPALFEFVMGPKGRALVDNFGAEQFGYPIFGVGEPPEGQGAHVPKLTDKPGLEQPTEDEIEAEAQRKERQHEE